MSMEAAVTSKGQVTIPKAIRDRFGIGPGSVVDFVAGPDGIRLRKVLRKSDMEKVIGCLKDELSGQEVEGLMDDLRGEVEIPGGA